MATTPEALLGAADVLSNGQGEVDWRNAASRAYYAAYHRCQPRGSTPASSSGGRRPQNLIQLQRKTAVTQTRPASLRDCG